MHSNRHFIPARAVLAMIAVASVIGAASSPAAARRSDAMRRAAGSAAPTVAAHDIKDEQILKAYGKLPVSFVENRGQTDARVRYYAQGNRFAFYLTREEVVLSFAKEKAAPEIALALRFVHSNPLAVIEGGERAPGEVNYFRGADPAGWRTQLPTYRQVVYRELWPGVDLRLHEQAGVLKYEFRVRPGGRPADI